MEPFPFNSGKHDECVVDLYRSFNAGVIDAVRSVRKIFLLLKDIRNMNLNKRSSQWAVLLLLGFIWGASFILMKKSLRSFSYDQVAGFRMFIAFLAFL